MFSPCIIIPSYAANRTRVEDALNLFQALLDFFPTTPVYVLAQEWDRSDQELCPSNIHMIDYPKLGITKARQNLRQWVLENTTHTHFIFLDDDAAPLISSLNTEESQEIGARFLKCVSTHPTGYALQRYPFYLNFAVVSRDIFEQVDFPNLSVQPIDGYEFGSEDLAFTATLSMRFPEWRYYISCGLVDGRRDADNHRKSTWIEPNTPMTQRFDLLDATLKWLQKQPYFIPLPDNEFCYSHINDNTFYLWSALDKDGTVAHLFGY